MRAACWALAVLLVLTVIGGDTRSILAPWRAALAQDIPRTELVRVQTADGVQLEGAFRPAAPPSEIGALLVHGFGGSFRSGVPASLGSALAQRGVSSLALNMRDHGCCTYAALFEDSVSDIGAGARFLHERGASRIVLIGHSLGVNRVAYYQAQLVDPAIRGLVLLAGVGNAHQVAVLAGGRATVELLDEAARRIAENDRADELMEVPFGPLGPPGRYLFTPRSLISHGGPSTNSDYFKWLPEIEPPLLMVHATADVFSFVQRPALAKQSAVRSARADIVYIEGADHEFSQHGAALAEVVARWLREVFGTP
jgi:pimeloyl-ACP methyl ester carboxylesterase